MFCLYWFCLFDCGARGRIVIFNRKIDYCITIVNYVCYRLIIGVSDIIIFILAYLMQISSTNVNED